MSFRVRLLTGFLLLALLPLAAFALGVRRQVAERIAASFEARADVVAGTIESRLEAEGAAISGRLEALAAEIAADNRLRRAIVREDPSERPYLLDYAGRAMRLTGLSVLQLQDEEGRILSSGHFRAEFDRLDPALSAALGASGATPGRPDGELPALAPVRTPSGAVLALLRVEPVTLGSRRLVLVGGDIVDEPALDRLAPDDEVKVVSHIPAALLDAPAAASASPEEFVVAREIPVRWAGPDGTTGEARFVGLPFPRAPAGGARGDRTLVPAAPWASPRPPRSPSRPGSPAGSGARSRNWPGKRRGWTSTGSTWTSPRTGRTRSARFPGFSARCPTASGSGAVRLREAERRATLGEIARQVNHDVKNGLVPIRNVFRHLVEVAESEPEALPDVLAERRGTIESGIGYLEGLAANYARLAPRLDLRDCDAAAVAREVATGAGNQGVRLVGGCNRRGCPRSGPTGSSCAASSRTWSGMPSMRRARAAGPLP